MHSSVLLTIGLVLIVWGTYANSFPFTESCDSCGKECLTSCGTRGFRTCCLNYVKKRSTPVSTGSQMRLELMMVLPELAHYYPSLKNFIPESSEDNESLKMIFEKPFIDKIKYPEPET